MDGIRTPISAYLIYGYFYTIRGIPKAKKITPSLVRIAESLNIDKNTVLTSIRFLIDNHLLLHYKIDKKYRQGGKNIIYYAAACEEAAMGIIHNRAKKRAFPDKDKPGKDGASEN
jgi:hypothetical protein